MKLSAILSSVAFVASAGLGNAAGGLRVENERNLAVLNLPAALGVSTPLVAGIYTSTPAVGLTGTLTLNAGFECSPVWKFTITGAFSTAAGSEVVFSNVPTLTPACPIFAPQVNWVVTGAVTLGANSHVIGNMLSTAGAITLGAYASAGNLDAGAALTLGAGGAAGALNAGAATTLGAGVTCTGITACLPPPNPNTPVPTVLLTALGGQTLMTGHHNQVAAVSLTGVLTLDANYACPAEWTLTIGGAFTTAAGSTVVFSRLPSGCAPEVNWETVGAVTLGATSVMFGNLTSTGGAITFGAGAEAVGNLDAFAAITLGALNAGAATTLGAGVTCTGITACLPPPNPNTPVPTVLLTALGGQTLMTGHHNQVAAVGLTGVLTLDANYACPAEWTLTIGGAFTTAAGSTAVFINLDTGCVTAPVVNWETVGAVTLGATSTMFGNLTSTGGAITFG
eukprot:CAMPEP_0198154550 /NCGR_PEP_ID=MMETSP1443-20131203/68656_1 /TAXON_ID=186043 /ORGANISM="Entomoneis sp., Strain CCMP2396" /LENGTH=451 /DNA_ID=CAMNT_0043821229 /DNA_START=197 /DNA_END=1548 /DNA_ORIENTATION=-